MNSVAFFEIEEYDSFIDRMMDTITNWFTLPSLTEIEELLDSINEHKD